MDAAPPRRAVLRLSGFGLLLHEKANTTKEQHGAASSFPAAGRLSTLSILSIFGACLIISSMFGGCPCCLYLSISGAVQFISRGRGCVEALASCCTKGTGRVDMSNERANAAHGAKNSTGRPLLLHTAGRLSTLSIFGRRLDVAPRGGAVLRLWPPAVRKGYVQRKGERCTRGKRTARGGLLFSTRRGVCLLLHDTPRVLQCSAVKGKRCTRAKERRGGGLLFSIRRGVCLVVYIGRRFVSRRLRLFALPLFAPRAGVLV